MGKRWFLAQSRISSRIAPQGDGQGKRRGAETSDDADVAKQPLKLEGVAAPDPSTANRWGAVSLSRSRSRRSERPRVDRGHGVLAVDEGLAKCLGFKVVELCRGLDVVHLVIGRDRTEGVHECRRDRCRRPWRECPSAVQRTLASVQQWGCGRLYSSVAFCDHPSARVARVKLNVLRQRVVEQGIDSFASHRFLTPPVAWLWRLRRWHPRPRHRRLHGQRTPE